MIKAVIFDFGGVIVTDDYNPVIEKAKKKVSREKLLKFQEIEQKAGIGQIGEQDFIDALNDCFGTEVWPKLDVADDRYRARVDQQILSLIRELKREYLVGLLSNNFSFWTKNAKGQAYMSLFDARVFSSDVGMTKPNLAIYRLVAEKLNVAPGECVFIDNVKENVNGAVQAGMKGIQYFGLNDLKTRLEEVL